MKELLEEMHHWMASYMKSFYSEDEEVQLGISLKEKHTGYVTAHARALAVYLALPEHDVQLAEMIGLFHDVGRFRQYSIYKTFNDAQSEDHADLGLKVLDELDFMKRLSPEDEAVVRFAIRNHNKMVIEPVEDKRKLLFAKIIRDADKLDIYRVLAPFVKEEMADKAPNFIKSLTSQEPSPDFAEAFKEGKQADYHNIRTHGDRKIVRLMWVYDVNFGWTLRKIMEQGYIDLIIDSLPKSPQVEEGLRRMRSYIEQKCAAPDTI